MRTAPRDPEGQPGAPPACGPGRPGCGQQLGVPEPSSPRWGRGRVAVKGTLRRSAEPVSDSSPSVHTFKTQNGKLLQNERPHAGRSGPAPPPSALPGGSCPRFQAAPNCACDCTGRPRATESLLSPSPPKHLTFLQTAQNQGPLWKPNALRRPAASESRPALSKNFSWETNKQAGHQPDPLTDTDEAYTRRHR